MVVKIIINLNAVQCGGFGMINRNLINKQFSITKDHNLPHYMHRYYKSKFNYDMILNNKISKSDFYNEEIRYNLFKIYFTENTIK